MKAVVAVLGLAATTVAFAVIVLVELVQRLLPLLLVAVIGWFVYIIVRSGRRQTPSEDPLITAWAQSRSPLPATESISSAASPSHRQETWSANDTGYLKWTTPALPAEPQAAAQPRRP